VYLTVPDDSGDLVLQTGDQEISLTPVTGNYIFFNPETPHLVTKNNSPTHRLSIGMNIGLKKDRIDWKRV
jgi:quercetin dioxygenase-like cupin family protein